MSRILAPKLLLLSFALPGASCALGLGDIHVQSALHQPFAAQIDLVGATADELGRLSAAIADPDTFQRHGLDLPIFLATTGVKVSQDKQGHPVLALRSTDAFTEPVVTFLVDVHSPNGELIREYTVLLDPSGLTPEQDSAESTSAVPVPTSVVEPHVATPTATPDRAIPTRDSDPAGRTYTVASRDTLDRIVTIAGARSRSDRHRMMIAIFRGNAEAFQTNLNKLRSGATLHFPSADELAAISADEANREFATQMAAWRASHHRLSPTNAVAARTGADAGPDANSDEAINFALRQRVRSLEKSLDELKQDLKQPVAAQTPASVVAQPPASVAGDPAAVAPVAAPIVVHRLTATAATTEEAEAATRVRHPPRRGIPRAPLAIAVGLLLAAGVWFYRRRRSVADISSSPVIEPHLAVESPHRRDTAEPVRRATKDRKDVPDSADKDVEDAGLVDFVPVPSAPPLPPRPKVTLSPMEEAALSDSYFANEVSGDAMRTGLSAALVQSGWFKDSEGVAKVSASADSKGVNSSADDSTSAPGGDLLPTSDFLTGDTTVSMTPPPVHDGGTTVAMAPEAQVGAEAGISPDTEMSEESVERKLTFFNPDSDTTHVVIASGLNEPAPFVERRKNPVDVLQQALEREPDRSDLRLKLLELYYTAAAQNRRAFLEVTRQFAKDDKLASAKEWSQIADMGRTIAPDDELFSASTDKKAVA